MKYAICNLCGKPYGIYNDDGSITLLESKLPNCTCIAEDEALAPPPLPNSGGGIKVRARVISKE